MGVSGGPDSLALLHALRSLQAELSLTLHVASLDHSLRAESAADVRFIQALAHDWGLPFSTETIDVHALAVAERVGVETAARRARYDFLARVAQQVGARYVAVAHHAGDQAESVLLHLLRGAGTRGLQGMRPSSPLPGTPDLTLLRPLLNHSRQDILDYCTRHDLQPREDSTNQDTRILRNYIRHNVLPVLKTVNPQAELALLRLADNAAYDQDFIEAHYQQQVRPHVTLDAEHVTLDRERFATLHPALQRRWLLHAIDHLDGQPGAERIEQALAAWQRGAVGQVIDLAALVQLRVDYKTLVVEKAGAPPSYDGLLLPSGFEQPFNVPGIVQVEQSGWSLRLDRTRHQSNAVGLLVPPGATVCLRGRRPGDRFCPPGLDGHSQKLSDWMINHKLPRALRDRVPLLVVDDRVAAIGWAGRWIVAQPFFPAPDSDTLTHLTVAKPAT